MGVRPTSQGEVSIKGDRIYKVLSTMPQTQNPVSKYKQLLLLSLPLLYGYMCVYMYSHVWLAVRLSGDLSCLLNLQGALTEEATEFCIPSFCSSEAPTPPSPKFHLQAIAFHLHPPSPNVSEERRAQHKHRNNKDGPGANEMTAAPRK